MDDLTLLRTFYESYGEYFGDDTTVALQERTLDATDRATIAGLRAVLAQGMSAGTAKTPKAVEGEARQPGGVSHAPKRRYPNESPGY